PGLLLTVGQDHPVRPALPQAAGRVYFLRIHAAGQQKNAPVFLQALRKLFIDSQLLKWFQKGFHATLPSPGRLSDPARPALAVILPLSLVPAPSSGCSGSWLRSSRRAPSGSRRPPRPRRLPPPSCGPPP